MPNQTCEVDGRKVGVVRIQRGCTWIQIGCSQKSSLRRVDLRLEGTSKVGGKAVTNESLGNKEEALDKGWGWVVMTVNTWKVQVSPLNLPLYADATTSPRALNHCSAGQHDLYFGTSPQMYVVCIPKFSCSRKV